MTKLILGACLAFVVFLCGCTKDNSTAVKPPPPHGGSLIAIPDNNGFVEIVKKPIAGKETSVSGEMKFYFFKDEFTPFTPAPTTATLTCGKNKTVTLKPDGDALVTPDGPPLFDGGEPDGTLSVQLGGKNLSVPLGVR